MSLKYLYAWWLSERKEKCVAAFKIKARIEKNLSNIASSVITVRSGNPTIYKRYKFSQTIFRLLVSFQAILIILAIIFFHLRTLSPIKYAAVSINTYTVLEVRAEDPDKLCVTFVELSPLSTKEIQLTSARC